ncbi:hypothetical protein C2E23DRAFT_563976 [Lenzites betulinus]|nr:hypothetical protein C2E23DRAFT_563976 [Lenzites betulinus]
MAVAAKCANCANDLHPSHPHQSPANPGVVLGVLGGCALVALVVAVVVPLVRHRRHRPPVLTVRRSLYHRVRTGSGDVERDADADWRGGGIVGLHLPSRSSPVRHQKLFAGPDARPQLHPLLLDPLRPLSALTWSWSDLPSRRARSPRARSVAPGPSPSPSAMAHADAADHSDSDDATDPRSHSHSTTRATTSHRSSTSTRPESVRERECRRDELGRPVISDAATTRTRRALPLPPRSPTPPGLPSKREYSIVAARRASLPLPITPTSPSDAAHPRAAPPGMPLFAPVPSASSASSQAPLAGPALARHPSSRHRPTTQKPGMEPVLEDSTPDAYAYAETRSLQLPSPPASPEQPQPYPHFRASPSSAAHLSTASLSNPNAAPAPAPSTSSSASRRRPSLTASQSAPTATMPYRPRSSTGPAIPLTAAFQTSVLRSGSQSTAASSAASAGHHRYPSIVTSPLALPPPSSLSAVPHRDATGRVRPSSVSVATGSSSSSTGAGGLLSPDSPEMARPSDAFRRMSTTDIRHRRPSQAGAGTEQNEPRAFLRTADAARTTQIQPGLAYDPRAASMSGGPGGPSFTTPPPHPLSPPALSPTPPRLSVHTRGASMAPSSATWRGSSSSHSSALSPQQPIPYQQYHQQYQQQQQQQYQQQQQQSQQQQQQGPALVRRKDSTALRPLPVSALMGPPSAGMAALSLAQGGGGVGGSRSRSNSVRSSRTGTSAVQLPPMDLGTPLNMSLRSSPEEDEREEGYLRR